MKTAQEVREKTEKMIGYTLTTHQTPKAGLKVDAVLVHEGVDIVRQIYFAFILDRNSQSPAIVASTEGGVEIEEVAKNNPDAVKVYPVGLETGITKEILDTLERDLKLEECPGFRHEVKALYKLFTDCDATQV